MSELLSRLHAIAEIHLPRYYELLSGPSWAEQSTLNRRDMVQIAHRLKQSNIREDEFSGMMFFGLPGTWSLYGTRLACHAYWCAWNLYLDPPKKIDPLLAELTAHLQSLLPDLGGPSVFVTPTRLGLDRLERLGIPPKPLRPVIPGRRARGM